MPSIIKEEDMDPIGVVNLMAAVMNRARLDYISGKDLFTSGKTTPYSKLLKGEEARDRIRKFIRSEWGHFFALESVDPERIIENWDEQKRYQDWRNKMRCGSCKSSKCPHQSFSYHKDWICKKEEKKREKTEYEKMVLEMEDVKARLERIETILGRMKEEKKHEKAVQKVS